MGELLGIAMAAVAGVTPAVRAALQGGVVRRRLSRVFAYRHRVLMQGVGGGFDVVSRKLA